MEEKKYNISFMREYKELYELTDKEISEMFKIDGRVVIGFNAIGKYLSGEKTIRESVMEEILYELNYKDYNSFKQDIINKINLKKKSKTKKLEEDVKMEKKQELNQKVVLKEDIDTIHMLEAIDFNKMKNLDRIIVSLLCDETLSMSNKKISEILGVSEEYIRTIYRELLNYIKLLIDKEEEKSKEKKLNK